MKLLKNILPVLLFSVLAISCSNNDEEDTTIGGSSDGTVLVDFENLDNVTLKNDSSGGALISVESKTGMSGKNSSVGIIEYKGLSNWEAVVINTKKYINVTNKGAISVDFYQSTAVAKQVLLKLENVKTKQGNIYNAVEVLVTTEAKAGWQKLVFDFGSDQAYNSYPNESADVIIDQYATMAIFIDFGSPVAGTYWIDNITGAEWGDSVAEVVIPTGQAPYGPINFEADGQGARWTWTVFENVDNPPVEFVANPSKTGINTSSTVAKITARKSGAQWVGCESKHGSDIGEFKFDASNKIVKMMVYKTVISDVGIKFAEANGEAQPEVKVKNTKINQWEELTFDLSGSIGKGITGIVDQIIIFPDFNARSTENVVYFDNITFGN